MRPYQVIERLSQLEKKWIEASRDTSALGSFQAKDVALGIRLALDLVTDCFGRQAHKSPTSAWCNRCHDKYYEGKRNKYR